MSDFDLEYMKEYLRLYIECRSYDIKIKRKNELSKEREIVLNFIDFSKIQQQKQSDCALQYNNIHNPKK